MRVLSLIFALVLVQQLYGQKEPYKNRILFREEEYSKLTDSQKVEKIRRIENDYLYKKPYPLIIVDGILINTTSRDTSTGKYHTKGGFENFIDYNDVSEIVWTDGSSLDCDRVQIFYAEPKKSILKKKK